ncbi:MAG: DUF11 domain-containing protein [Planctomycetes bacterium]|nr:DUF11 domain-containing protein [Planctomycetota bacterium]
MTTHEQVSVPAVEREDVSTRDLQSDKPEIPAGRPVANAGDLLDEELPTLDELKEIEIGIDGKPASGVGQRAAGNIATPNSLAGKSTENSKPAPSGVKTVGNFTNEAKTIPETDEEKIPALGPEQGKTVNPKQPLPAYRKSVGAQDASLTVDWVTPESIVVGEKGKFDLVLRNRGRVTLEQITITNVLPDGFRLIKATPAPTQNGKQPSWIVAQLKPQEEARISLLMIPLAVGDAQSHARVDFHVTATAKFRVVEPMLKITAEGPDHVLVGNQAVFAVTIENPGSGKTTNVRMKAFLPKGLQAIAQGDVYDLGTLNPGESRSVRILAKVLKSGDHKITFVTVADHNLRDEASQDVQGRAAQLAVTLAGPKFRYLARPAKYKVRIKNTGTAPAHNVSLSCRVPRAFAYLSGGKNGRYDASSKTINWFVGTLAAGKEFSTEFGLRAVNRGNFPILAHAAADRGLTGDDKHVTRVEGIAAILLEVVDVDDPVEVGAETFYEILVTNQGTAFARNVAIKATVPTGMQILGSTGPSVGKIDGQTITFAVLPKLAPRADAIYRIKVRTTQAGDLRIEATVMADSLESPVKELESTKVYKDD